MYLCVCVCARERVKMRVIEKEKYIVRPYLVYHRDTASVAKDSRPF